MSATGFITFIVLCILVCLWVVFLMKRKSTVECNLSKRINVVKKITLITNTKDDKYPYIFEPIYSKEALDQKCKENNLLPATVQEVNLFTAHYAALHRECVYANYYGEYECWGIELGDGDGIALIMKKIQ